MRPSRAGWRSLGGEHKPRISRGAEGAGFAVGGGREGLLRKDHRDAPPRVAETKKAGFWMLYVEAIAFSRGFRVECFEGGESVYF
jgi:hypothetical protein